MALKIFQPTSLAPLADASAQSTEREARVIVGGNDKKPVVGHATIKIIITFTITVTRRYEETTIPQE